MITLQFEILLPYMLIILPRYTITGSAIKSEFLKVEILNSSVANVKYFPIFLYSYVW
jgi:hypothetical protein